MHKLLFIILLLIECIFGLFDPLSIGAAIGAGVFTYKFDAIKDLTYCKVNECCNENYIPRRVDDLENELESKLIGQHIVKPQLIPALRAHFSKNIPPKKALVLSLHGTPGTGKNFVADLMCKTLYKEGKDSHYVHFYKGKADFNLHSESKQYAAKLLREVKAAVAECPQSLFVFDEVEKMPPGIFEPLSSLLDYGSKMKGVDFSQAVFVFLSNTAGKDISSHLISLMEQGTLREDTKLSDFDKIIHRVAYDEENGMKHSSLVDSYLVDHYIPFLPLESKHVYRCLEEEFLRWGKAPNPTIIKTIIEDNVSFDSETKTFALSGCKSLESKVQVKLY